MTKTNIRKRAISILLILMVMLTMTPMTASAAATGDGSKGNPFVVTTYEDWKEKMELTGEKYIQLGADIDTSTMNGGYGLGPNDFVSAIGRSYLDLNGKKLTLKKAQLESGVSGTYFIRLIAGELIIDDSKGGGEIVGVNNVTRRYMQLIDVTRDTKLTLNSGRLYLECNPDSDTPNATILFSGTVEINGGTVSVSKWGEWDEPAAYIIRQNFALQAAGKTSSCCALINGGTFDGRVLLGAIAKDSGVADNVITGGDFKKSIYIQKDEEKTGDVPLNVSIQGGTYHYTPGYMTVTSGENAGKRESNPLHLFQFATMGFRDDMVYCDNVVYDAFKGGSLFEPDKYDMNAFASMFPKNAIITAEGQEYDYLDVRDDEPQHISVSDAAFTGSSSALDLAHLVNSHYKTIKVTTLPEDALKNMTLKVGSDGTALPAQGTSTVPGDVTLGSDGKLKETVYISARGNKQLKEMFYSNPSKIDFGYRLNIFKDGVRVTDYTGDSRTYAALGDEISVSVQLRDFEFEEGVYTIRLALWPYLRGSEAQIGETLVGLWKLTAKEHVDLPIDSVTLNVPKLKVGDKSGDFTLSGTNTGVSNTVTTEWKDIPADGAKESTFYSAVVKLKAENGYVFDANTNVTLIGDNWGSATGISSDGKTMTVYVKVLVRHEHTFGDWKDLGNSEYHFRECSCLSQEKEPHNWEDAAGDKYKCTVCGHTIDGEKTRITYMYASLRSPIAGEHPGDYTPAEWVKIGGANYKVESIVWKNMDDDTVVNTFEAGKIYTGTVTFKAETGFVFAQDSIHADDIFSSNVENVGNYTLNTEATILTATFKLKDNTVVRPGLQVKVKLPTLNDKIGQSFPAAELVDTNLPDDVELTTSVYENISADPITGSVKPNKTYLYAVNLKFKNSSNDITTKYNVSYTVTDGGDAVYHTDNLAGYGILARYQTPDTSKISSVALTVTAPKYGEAPATSATGANDTLYDVGEPTWSPAVTDGKFGEKAYTVSIPVIEKSGYSFDANCVYTVNGYLATSASGKVRYTFPALTVPHTHTYGAKTMLDDSQHSRSCMTCGDVEFEAHNFSTWAPDTTNDTQHFKECSVCHHKVVATHVEKSKITVIPAGIGTEGKWKTECVDCGKQINTGTIPALRKITVSTAGSGTAAASPAEASVGTEITLTATPNAGYHFKAWIVKAGGVTLANESSATTTFTMPANDVTIEASFEKNASGGGSYAPTTQKPEITIIGSGKAELSADGKTATITAAAGYELASVVLNGKEMGKVEKLTGLKTGDKATITFRAKAGEKDGKEETDKMIAREVSKLRLTARSARTAKKNVKLVVKSDLKAITDAGYTVKYKFYRSTKKSAGYKAMKTGKSGIYINTYGKKGTMYYYKARVMIYDKDGNFVAQTALKQCKYANRLWTK